MFSSKPLWGACKISAVYLTAGWLWILLSDKGLGAYSADIKVITNISMFKGGSFVLITALLIFVLSLRSLKRVKKMEDKLQHLTYHDVLTELPNKRALYATEVETTLADSSHNAILMLIDIDNFKYINDTMGHSFGDRLIVKTSERLLSIVGQAGVLYRFGGDEFIILMRPLKDRTDIDRFAGQVLAGFKEVIEIDNSLLHISISIGISIYPHHGREIMELVKRADIAMYKAKEAGKDSFVVFDYHLKESFSERMEIEHRLYAAMEQDEFELFYQPQVDLESNQVTGLEALLRWNCPDLGYIPPLKFIKVAEASHLIIPLGTWVLVEACKFLKHLHEQGFEHLTMSVNISMLQLLQSDFNTLVMDTLQLFDLAPEHLELEITETILVESYSHVSTKLNQLRDHNIKIALDDFGTGYSSLSYLTHLPISTLKIDKSFIDSIPAKDNQATLVEQIIMIGKRMNMTVIAEGVESKEQLEYLQEQGCDKIQGYLFSKPIAAENLEQLLNSWEDTKTYQLA
ncbi:GGDEF domain-containing protein [Paenibacillus sp. 19GGS1-52]|uniref:putative bifunctional diguanylate cyclase/phosphodiesterase n=1 Tax=Paenibacillus sp. 19GGS1-52 TaxID=2758563 RepID=UPI001EFA88C1|nr:bifunctional diguanylate cyclase/phosphodiesterase [Paenibacillus sp. 19GGS1-52]ULO07702.1 GGDEF domain-containing protein [Paenibacillus sp. 19GGS1-52]